MLKVEMTRLQGIVRASLNVVVVAESHLGHQLGNAMSLNVVERILVSLLAASGLVAHGDLVDEWASGVRGQELIASVGHGFASKRERSIEYEFASKRERM